MNTSVTAMEENAINQRSDTMALAINKVMGHEEQSYDDFMGGFQHITKDSIKKSMLSNSANKTNVVNQRKNPNPPANKHEEGQKLEQMKSEHTEEDDLEEEMLDCGTKTTEKTPIDSSSRVKFDNFVEDEMSDDEPSGYVASFGQETDESRSTSCLPGERVNIEVDKQVGMMDTSQPSLPSVVTEEPDITSQIILDHKRNLKSTDQDESSVDDLDHKGHTIEVLGNTNQVTLFPGEAEPQSDITGKELTNHTHLDFAVVTCKSCDTNDQVQTNLSFSDEVQPFSLDNDFDYDNVTLTPKFTALEVEHLKSFLPNNGMKA